MAARIPPRSPKAVAVSHRRRTEAQIFLGSNISIAGVGSDGLAPFPASVPPTRVGTNPVEELSPRSGGERLSFTSAPFCNQVTFQPRGTETGSNTHSLVTSEHRATP